MTLKYLLRKNKSDGYSDWSLTQFSSFKKIAKVMRSHALRSTVGKSDLKGCISLKSSNSRFNSNHILMVDCDDASCLNRATSWLAKNGIAYYPIASSPSHYWLICNRIEPYDILINETMPSIPGHDKEFVNMCRGQKHIYIRAYRTVLGYPKFPEDGLALWHPDIVSWIKDVKAHFELPEIVSLDDIRSGMEIEGFVESSPISVKEIEFVQPIEPEVVEVVPFAYLDIDD